MSEEKVNNNNILRELLVIDIISAYNLPLNMNNESSIYIKLSIFDKNGIKRDDINKNYIETLPRYGTINPVWNCRRKLNININDDNINIGNTLLYFELNEKDKLKTNIIGSIGIKYNDIILNKIMNLSFRMNLTKVKKKPVNCGLKFNVYKYNEIKYKRKYIIFIRHGTSEWNEAQKDKNMYNMYKKKDHPLNKEGINQAIKLNGIWKIMKNINNNIDINNNNNNFNNNGLLKQLKQWGMNINDLNMFLNASLILSSPLTRATQTCLLTLMNHKTLIKNGIILNRNLREIKTFGGKDTLSSKTGNDIKKRCIDNLIKIKPKLKKDIKIYQSIKFNCDDVNSKWWTILKDTMNDFDKRLNDFINYIKYDLNTTIICVGHSLWLKSFFKKYLPKFEESNINRELNNETQDLKAKIFKQQSHQYSESLIGMISNEINNTNNNHQNIVINRSQSVFTNKQPSIKSKHTKQNSSIYDIKFKHTPNDTLRGYLDSCQHSNIFMDIVNDIRKDQQKTAALHKKIKCKKVNNAGCVKVECNFGDNFKYGMEIDDVQLMFGTELV